MYCKDASVLLCCTIKPTTINEHLYGMNHYKYDILKFAPLEMIVDVNPFSLLLLPTFAISLDFDWCVAVEFVLCYRIYVFTMTS